MPKSIGITLLILFCFISPGFGQEIEVEVLFPGEGFNYEPYEFIEMKYFPSGYDSAFVIDSAVYTLTSFEIDPIQMLSLPVFLISSGDSIPISSTIDSLVFVEVVPEATDTTSLITDLSHTEVPLEFNYPYLLIGLGVFIAVIILLIIIFGKSIVNIFRIRRVKSGYRKFSEHFDELVYQVNKTREKDHLEAAIAYWKKYLEKLEKKPYTKLTTREMVAINGDARLIDDLKEIDRNLYGRIQSGDVINRLNSIKSLAQEYQEKKIASIKNG